MPPRTMGTSSPRDDRRARNALLRETIAGPPRPKPLRRERASDRSTGNDEEGRGQGGGGWEGTRAPMGTRAIRIVPVCITTMEGGGPLAIVGFGRPRLGSSFVRQRRSGRWQERDQRRDSGGGGGGGVAAAVGARAIKETKQQSAVARGFD